MIYLNPRFTLVILSVVKKYQKLNFVSDLINVIQSFSKQLNVTFDLYENFKIKF